MGERGDVGRTNCIVARGERGSTQVARRVDRCDLPPLVSLGLATLVTLKVIFYQYLWFIRVMTIAPPSQAECRTEWAYHYSVLAWAVPPQDDWIQPHPLFGEGAKASCLFYHYTLVFIL